MTEKTGFRMFEKRETWATKGDWSWLMLYFFSM